MSYSTGSKRSMDESKRKNNENGEQYIVLKHLLIAARNNDGAYENDGWDGKDPFHRSLMHFAALYKCKPFIIELILELSPKTIMSFDKEGRLPLHVAIKRCAPVKRYL